MIGTGLRAYPYFLIQVKNFTFMHDIDLLFQYYYRPLCLYATHYLQDMEAAKDTVQDCFVRLIEQNREEKASDNIKAYLYASVRNACLNELRKTNPIDTNLSPYDLEGVISDEEAIDRSFHEADLWTAIDNLPARCRQIFLMSKRDNMKYKEIAQQLAISEKTVEHQISKAFKILRKKEGDIFYMLTWVA